MDCKLLPHVRETVYGLDPKSAQIIGWEISKFNIPPLWSLTTGKGVRIAVVDTGCDLNHPDLVDNIDEGYNFVHKNNIPQDDNGHGSHCAGTIAASDNGLGMIGVAPKATIMPVKVLSENGSGSMRDVAKGVMWAADNGADFITMSLGSPEDSPVVQQAINYAASKGVIIFCAAGNSGPNAGIMSPARCENTIAIGSVNRKLKRSSFSCCGPELDFLSPGEDIFSCVPDDGYALMSGTSMATPFFVGCSALALSFARSKQNSSLSNFHSYIEFFKRNAMPLLDEPKDKNHMGYGIVNTTLDMLSAL